MFRANFNIFVDLDGVLAGFDDHFTKNTGLIFAQVEKEQGEDAAWGHIINIPHFWLDLPFLHEGQILWREIAHYSPIILSSPSSRDTARAKVEKRLWVDRYLGQHVPTLFCKAKDKQGYARHNAILIDDWLPNIKQWAEQGGIPIHHQGNAGDTINLLDALRS